MHTALLLEINTILTGAADTDEAVGSCLHAFGSLFNLPCAIQPRDGDGGKQNDGCAGIGFRGWQRGLDRGQRAEAVDAVILVTPRLMP